MTRWYFRWVTQSAEPINIFAPKAEPERVLAEIRERYATIVDGEGASWRSLRIDFPNGALTLLHDPDYYSGADWLHQRRGMQGYFRRFPLSPELHDRVEALIGGLGFALATRFDPDYDNPASDDRFAIISGVTRMVDGVIFTPYGLRDADGRFLCGAGGEHDEDAEWPSLRLSRSAQD